MASNTTGKSPQSNSAKSEAAPASSQRVVPAVPLSFAWSQNRKEPKTIPPNVSATLHPISDRRQHVEKHSASTLNGSSNAKNQTADSLSDNAHAVRAFFEIPRNAELPGSETAQQPSALERSHSGKPISPRKSVPLDQIPAQEVPPTHSITDHPVPHSAASSNFSGTPYSSNESFHISSHTSHPSVNGIVFGGYADSSSSSPAPPGPPGNLTHPPPPLTNLSLGEHPPLAFIPPSHARDLSDSHPNTAYPPPPNMNPYAAPQFLGQPMPHGAPQLYSQPPSQWPAYTGQDSHSAPSVYQKPFGGPPPFPDGPHLVSRPASAVSCGTQDRDKTRTLAMQAPHMNEPALESHEFAHGPVESGLDATGFHHSVFGLPMQTQPLVPVPIEEDSSAVLRDYLCAQFGNSDFADYILNLTHVAERFPPLLLPIHSVIISRSPMLAQLIKAYTNPTRTADGNFKVLALPIDDRFINGFAFSDALRHLYGAPLVNVDHFTHGFTQSSLPLHDQALSVLNQHMDYALALAASGHLLQLDNIAARGIDLATRLLRWETLEQALPFALDGGIHHMWRLEFGAGPADRDSFSSSDDNSSSTKPSPSPSHPTYAHHATRLLHAIVDFLAHNLPADIGSGAPRLPPLATAAAPTNPRLSQLRFGDVPPLLAPSPHAALRALPFAVLKVALEHPVLADRLGAEAVAELMHGVVTMRRSNSVASGEGGRDVWEEKVVTGEGDVARLVRRRRGADTPPSGGSEQSVGV